MSNFIQVDYNPFEEENTSRYFDTTEEQREIYTSIKIGGENASLAYNECVSLRLSGNCNLQALADACKKTIERHASLRSIFTEDGMQFSFADNVTTSIKIVDLKNLQSTDFNNQFDAIISTEVQTPFNLQSGNVVRFHIILQSPTETILVITAHHIVCDGWSIGIIMQDISKFYSAAIDNKKPELAKLNSFEDYIHHQQNRKANGDHSRTEKFWFDLFASHTPVVDMPVDNPRPAIRTFNAARADVTIPEETAKGIKQFGAKCGSSYVNTLFAAFEVFLNKITRQTDLVVGLPAAGQSASGMYQLVGHCVNILPIKTTIDEKITFADYLKQRRNAMFDALDNQEFTMGSLLARLPLQRDPGRIPLVPVVFNVDLGLTTGVEFKGLTYKFESYPRKFENFEMFVNATGMGDALNFECTYNTDLFNADVIQLRLQEFLTLLNEIINHPTKKLFELNILGAEENRMNEWNSTFMEYDQTKSVHALVSEAAKIFSKNIAVDFHDNAITYSELEQQSDLLAKHLINNGVKQGDFVCVCLERSVEMVVALLAILKSGAAYVPVDPSFPSDRVAYMVDDSQSKIIITTSEVKQKLRLQNHTCALLDNGWQQTLSVPANISLSDVNSSALAYMIYTSGTTGKPKGVQIEHKAYVNLLLSFKKDLSFTDKDVFLSVTTISFDIAGLELLLPLISGGKVVIASKNDSLEAETLAQKFNKKNVTVFQATPVTFRILQEAKWVPSKSLKLLIGGEAVPADLAAFLSANCNNVLNVYGPTETTIWSTTYKIPPLKSTTEKIPVYIGKPLANTSVYVLDSFYQRVPIGVEGDIYIGGDGLSAGYYHNEQLTEERFVYVSFDNENIKRIYFTGDKGKLRIDGNIEYSGRTDNQVKIRGYRIETGEIETVMQKNTAVRQCVVIAREDNPGDKKLVAYFSLISGQTATADDFKTLLAANVPEYMIPSAFIQMENLPLTPNGKIDRKALPKPEIKTEVTDINFEEPNTPVENILTEIWSNILSLDRIGIHDNFFELGGHSLLGIKMMTEIEKKLGVKLNYPTLFSASTIHQLAKLINNDDLDIDFPVIVPFQPNGNKTPLFCMHMHNGNTQRWRVLVKYFDEDQPVYAIQPQGLDPKKPFHTDIKKMASFYIDEMKKIQPVGPYNLVGLCFGGVVVFEMCRQLTEAGEKINFGCMIDSYAPTGSKTMNKVVAVASEFMDMDMEKKMEFATDKAKNVGRKILAKVSGKKFDKMTGSVTETEAKPDIRFIHSTALLNYTSEPLNGKITFIRTGDPNAALYDDNLGWTKLVNGELEVIKVSGSSHDSIIVEEKYHSQLAQIIKKHLNG